MSARQDGTLVEQLKEHHAAVVPIVEEKIPEAYDTRSSPEYVTPAVQRHDVPENSEHFRQKVKVLADAHRALLRARHAQHDLPEGGTYMPEPVAPLRHAHNVPARTYVAEQSLAIQQPVEIVPPIIDAIPPHEEPHSKPIEKPTVHVPMSTHAPEKVVPAPQARPTEKKDDPEKTRQANYKPANPEWISSSEATKDELTLDMSGSVPRLVLVRKKQ
jgi:hypothetical protein